jgi:hypothetical protein
VASPAVMQQVERILKTHEFGPYRVNVFERADDEETFTSCW